MLNPFRYFSRNKSISHYMEWMMGTDGWSKRSAYPFTEYHHQGGVKMIFNPSQTEGNRFCVTHPFFHILSLSPEYERSFIKREGRARFGRNEGMTELMTLMEKSHPFEIEDAEALIYVNDQYLVSNTYVVTANDLGVFMRVKSSIEREYYDFRKRELMKGPVLEDETPEITADTDPTELPKIDMAVKRVFDL